MKLLIPNGSKLLNPKCTLHADLNTKQRDAHTSVKDENKSLNPLFMFCNS